MPRIVHHIAPVAIATLALIVTVEPARSQDNRRAGVLDEITVTAQKRAQSAQAIPLAITALTSEMLEANGATSVIDVADWAPNVVIDQMGSGWGPTLAATVRGLGAGFARGPVRKEAGIPGNFGGQAEGLERGFARQWRKSRQAVGRVVRRAFCVFGREEVGRHDGTGWINKKLAAPAKKGLPEGTSGRAGGPTGASVAPSLVRQELDEAEDGGDDEEDEQDPQQLPQQPRPDAEEQNQQRERHHQHDGDEDELQDALDRHGGGAGWEVRERR